MPRAANQGDPAAPGTAFTYDPKKGTVVQVYVDASGNKIDPNAINKSLADNPQASKGGYEGATPMQDPVEANAAATIANKGGIGDYSNFLGIYGLPADVQNKVNDIFANTPDVNQATALAMAYVRGTDWYAQTYPGIQEGIAKGIVGNEADYRNYLNQANQLSQQYYQTPITSQQMADYLKSGYSLTHIGQLYQGDAYAKANGADLRYLSGAFGDGQISNGDLQTLGQENAGLDTTVGQKLQTQIQKAQQKMNAVFSSTIATPSLSIGGNGLSSPSLAGTRGSNPDVAA